jgi:putative membrane protein insertion efficiency factor
MRRACLQVIRLYQRWGSPLLPPACRFEPTCSQYAREAIERYGVMTGLVMALVRLGKCHPLHPGGFDPVR